MDEHTRRQLGALTEAVLALTEIVEDIPVGDIYGATKTRLANAARELQRIQSEIDQQGSLDHVDSGEDLA